MGLLLVNTKYSTNFASEESEILFPAKTVIVAGDPVGLSDYNVPNKSSKVFCEGKPVVGAIKGNNGTVIVS